MTIKLAEVKKLENSKFEVIFRRNGQLNSVVITENRHWVADIQDYISTITSENPDFYEIWGYADFRKEVSRAIKSLTQTPELQIV